MGLQDIEPIRGGPVKVVVDGFTRHRGGTVYGCCRWVYKT